MRRVILFAVLFLTFFCSGEAFSARGRDLASFALSLATPPVITGFSPAIGRTGTSVTIDGQFFFGATDVSFNGTSSPFTIQGGNTRITTTVPTGATTGFITVTTPDGSGSSATEFVVDNTPPAVPVLSSTSPSGPSSDLAPFVHGTTDPLVTVRIYLNGCGGTPAAQTVSDTGGNFTAQISVAPNSTTSILASSVDDLGNESACSQPLTYVSDNTAPAPPAFTGSIPGSPANNHSPVIQGVAEPRSLIRLVLNGPCPGTPIDSTTADSTGQFQFIVNVPDDAVSLVAATAEDSAGNISSCSAQFAYREDNTPPAPPAFTGSSPSSPANTTTPRVLGSAEPGALVTLYLGPGCAGSPIGSGRANAGGLFSIQATVPQNAASFIYGTSQDSAGNLSACGTTPLVFVNDTTIAPNSLCGFKFADLNGNGVYEPGTGEYPLAGWEVVAADTLGDTVRATTDADGNYCFGGLHSATYRVFEAQRSGYAQTAGEPYYFVPVDRTTNVDSLDFGNFALGSISGVKYNDQNENGRRDNGEPGLENWSMTLTPVQVPAGIQISRGGVSMRMNLLGVGQVSVHFSGSYAVRYGTFDNARQLRPAALMALRMTADSVNGVAVSHTLSRLELYDYPGEYSQRFDGIESGGSADTGFFRTNIVLHLDTLVVPSGSKVLITSAPLFLRGAIGSYSPQVSGSYSLRSGSSQLKDVTVETPAGTVDDFTLSDGGPVTAGAPVVETTDNLGQYVFPSLVPGTYSLGEILEACWFRTTVDPAPVTIVSGSQFAGVDFGNHQGAGSVIVSTYYDGNHNQLREADEPAIPGVTYQLTGTNPVHSYSTVSDGDGIARFLSLPGDTYTLTQTVPAGYDVIRPKNGSEMFVVGGCESDSTMWLDAAKYTDSTFRTATPEQWGMAMDQAGKRKSVKCKPDKLDFVFNLKYRLGILKLKFPMVTSGDVRIGKDNPAAPVVFHWEYQNLVLIDFDTIPAAGQVLQFTGKGLKGKPLVLTYEWSIPTGGIISKGTLPAKPAIPEDQMKLNQPRLPMPDLHNVGEDLQRLGKFPVIMGVTSGIHAVVLSKYSDVLKSLVKVTRAGPLFHTDSTHCLDLINGRPMKRQMSSLAPDGLGGNKLFAEALALKMNILASEEGRFPGGLGDLIYDGSSVDPSPLDSMEVRDISLQADTILGCTGNPKGLNLLAIDYYTVIHRINLAFASTVVDTESWSCGNLSLKGVRTLKSVPYLRANPGAVHPVARRLLGNWDVQPARAELRQNYPNPFNPTTTIQFELPQRSIVSLKVYNTVGQEVAVLLDDQQMDDGTQEVEFDASGLASGVYFYSLIAQGIADPDEGTAAQRYTSVRKMVLIK